MKKKLKEIIIEVEPGLGMEEAQIIKSIEEAIENLDFKSVKEIKILKNDSDDSI